MKGRWLEDTRLMLKLLCPNQYVLTLSRINLDKLRMKGIKGIILDIDNTLMEWGSSHVTPDIISWLGEAKRRGFRLCILSNNLKGRIQQVTTLLGIPAAPGGIKPMKGAFAGAVRLLGTLPEETCVIGDQIFTDVLGGNLLGLYTILVKPIAEREFITTRIVRQLERLVIVLLKRRRLLKAPE